MVKIWWLLKEFFDGFLYEESGTTNMSELEGDESAEKPGLGLKILTPDQMLSLYRSKKLTKRLYNNLINDI